MSTNQYHALQQELVGQKPLGAGFSGMTGYPPTGREPGIIEKIDAVGGKASICLGLTQNIQNKLFGEEAVGEPSQCYPTCIEGNVESIRDRLNQLEIMLTRINDRL